MDWKVPTIDDDANCICGYNLRGLTFDHACPECGRDALDSVTYSILPRFAHTPDDAMVVSRANAQAGEATCFGIEACWLVRCAVAYAALQQPDGGGHASARDVCRGLREYARLHYGGMSAAIEQLRALEILTSEDVGEIVYAYVHAGDMHVSPGDSQADFNGLFTIENFHQARFA